MKPKTDREDTPPRDVSNLRGNSRTRRHRIDQIHEKEATEEIHEYEGRVTKLDGE